MKIRIFKNTLIVILCAVIAAVAVTLNVSYRYFNTQLEKELSQEASYAAAGLELNGVTYLESLDVKGVRITWVDSDGTVIFDNRADASAMENHLNRAEIQSAIENGSGTALRDSGTLSEHTLYYALKLDDGTVLRISSNQYTFMTVLEGMIAAVLIIVAFGLILSILISVKLSAAIASPLEKIDLDNPDVSGIYDELKPAVKRLKTQNQKILEQVNALKLHQAQLDATMDSMSEGMIITNMKAEIISCNKSALRLLASGAEKPLHVLDLNRSDEFRKTVLDGLAGKRSYCTLHVDNTYCTVIAAPVIHENEREGMVIMIIDETEKEERDALRREFTSNVSHELKTPLTSISGFAELICDGLTDEATTKAFSEKIYAESQRLIALVNDIIRLSRLDGGEIPYDDHDINLYALAKEVVKRFEPVAEKSDITITVEGEDTFIKGNSSILDEVISNLCDNAIKYNRRGGSVKVACRNSTLSVSDSGIGIAPAEQKRIFERFYRVDKSHSKEIGGTGLGLSIVKHGALFHNAEIAVESRLGEGTEISLEFKKDSV